MEDVLFSADSKHNNPDVEKQDIVVKQKDMKRILTHVIDGFVIEESLFPFEVSSKFLYTNEQLNILRKKQQDILLHEKEKDTKESSISPPATPPQRDTSDQATASCEQCGFFGPRVTFIPPGYQFCSLACSRKHRASCNKRTYVTNKLHRSSTTGRRGKRGMRSRCISYRGGYGRGASVKVPRASPSHSVSDSSFSECDETGSQSSDEGSVFSYGSSPSPEPTIPHDGDAPLRPLHWTVDDVCNYIKSLPDSVQHAEDFRTQEIDGSALLLLHEEHLIGTLNLPLGPALKLCAHIDRLRERDMTCR